MDEICEPAMSYACTSGRSQRMASAGRAGVLDLGAAPFFEGCISAAIAEGRQHCFIDVSDASSRLRMVAAPPPDVLARPNPPIQSGGDDDLSP